MRKFRNAALAAATATAVAFGGTAVASAEQTGPVKEGSSTFTSGSSDGDTDFGEVLGAFFKGGSSGVGKVTEGDKEADLDNIWGKERVDEGTPQWGRLWRDMVNWAALAAGLGIVIAAGNAALHEGWLPQIPFNVKLPF